MAAEKDQDLQKFLKDVDEIAKLVQCFNSDDPSEREKAFSEADRRISSKTETADVEGCRTNINKTRINTLSSSQSSPLEHTVDVQSQDCFLAALEQDARERATRRKENEALANALKSMGNEAFAKGDYATAVLRYTEGLERLKDMQVLYTNRAQAHIKLEKYKEAISDCEWALRCNESCVKAYVHMGKAYLGLKDYSEARKCYQKILDNDSKQERLVKGYLNQVDFEEQKALQEQKAQEEFALGKETAVTVKELLQKLARPDQETAYYAGGIRLLIASLVDCTERTLFRSNGGFRVLNDNKTVSRCLKQVGKEPMEVELCLSVILLWQEVCKENDENRRLLLTDPRTEGYLFTLLSCRMPAIQTECLVLLIQLSQTKTGKLLIISHLDLLRLTQCLLGFLTASEAQARTAIEVITNLAVEEKFRSHLRLKFSETVLPSFLYVLKNRKMVTTAVVPQCIAVMLSLSVDADLRRQMSGSTECWEACLVALDDCVVPSNEAECVDTLVALLSLMMNIAMQPSPLIQELAIEVTCRCLTLLSSKNGDILTKTVGVLSRVLKLRPSAVDVAVNGGVVKKFVNFLKASEQITSGYASQALAACTRSSSQAQLEVVKSDKKFSVLMKHLLSENEVIAGNVALCLGHCMTVPGAASSLLTTDILKVLLTYARGDAKELALQQNAAIALGKLCTAEPRFIEQLRELNGIGILSSCMKHVELL